MVFDGGLIFNPVGLLEEAAAVTDVEHHYCRFLRFVLHLSGKRTAKFPLDQPIPYTLIGRIVKFRVKENLLEADRTKH